MKHRKKTYKKNGLSSWFNYMKTSSRQSTRRGSTNIQRPDKITALLYAIVTVLLVVFTTTLFDSGLGVYKGMVVEQNQQDRSSLVKQDKTAGIGQHKRALSPSLTSQTFDSKTLASPRNPVAYENRDRHNPILIVPDNIGETWFLNNTPSRLVTVETDSAPSEKFFNIDK